MDPFDETVHVKIQRGVLDSIFDECDRYNSHETGGRLIGTYADCANNGLAICVDGVIEAGPAASRTATSFFQDGHYQEEVFRRIESTNPQIEHLGNWHTHHMNGYPTLSGGDRATYHRIVNHKKHNTDFFYALLVTARNVERYAIRHFILYRGDSREYEIPSSNVNVIDTSVVWPLLEKPKPVSTPQRVAGIKPVSSTERANDSQFFAEFCPTIKAFLSKTDNTVYWRGSLLLIDDSSSEIIVSELQNKTKIQYEIAHLGEPAASTRAGRNLIRKRFSSARQAVIALERDINRELFRAKAEQGIPRFESRKEN